MLLRRFADDILGPLRAHDQQNDTELERTLRVFLGNDGQWSTTAAELFVHVNTLRNRVTRIGELTGRDVTRLEDRVDSVPRPGGRCVELGATSHRVVRPPGTGVGDGGHG